MFKLIQPKSRQKVKEESKVLKDPTAMIQLPFEFYALKFIYNRFLDENNPKPMKEFSAHRIDLKPPQIGVSSSLKTSDLRVSSRTKVATDRAFKTVNASFSNIVNNEAR